MGWTGGGMVVGKDGLMMVGERGVTLRKTQTPVDPDSAPSFVSSPLISRTPIIPCHLGSSVVSIENKSTLVSIPHNGVEGVGVE
ncbi:hypothetical protein L6452_37707 [Arctium lappa]|uniref:Uncharacterized protein n=1 Tax=Arctium lappa TaxID=4217 RepID=A0ACB8Y323_ARCLA|nr:hypothetical protein L6452_37707 [Arctium lappa]